jgi:hypothetical protein
MPGEKRILGTIEHITCSNGEIDYDIRSDGQNLTMTSKDFKSLRMAVLLEGENSFQIDCGVSFAKTLSVIAFRPTLGGKARLTSITFVPDFFVLKTYEEMASARTVVVEDDTGRRGSVNETSDIKSEIRWATIAKNLRVPQDGETREAGVVEKIDCSGTSLIITTLLGGKRLRFFSNSPADVKVAWFNPKASQISLACGGTLLAANALLTFKRAKDTAGGFDGELKALEFVPEGFSLTQQH